jgi:hypothetical protein
MAYFKQHSIIHCVYIGTVNITIIKRFVSFIHQWLYSPLWGPAQMVRLFGRVISPSQSRYLHRGQHKHRINAHTDIHTLSGV